MTESLAPHIAIVGSGPSGCYLAQALIRSLPAASITIFDRLASPFGLIRYGVAADHQHTKAITRQFERLFQAANVRFAGNVELGRDLSLEQLREQFDAVILATGLSGDRELTLPGANLPGVVGAGTVTRALNAHPDEAVTLPDLGADVVLIGAGNVSLDLLRFLVKDRSQYDASDISDTALEHYLASPAERVTMASRSAAVSSKGDPQMLREIAALPCAAYSTPDDLAADAGSELERSEAQRLSAFAELVSPERHAAPGPAVTLRFGVIPLRILGTDHVEGVEFAAGDDVVVIPASAVITAVGFAASGPLAELLAAHSEIGRIEPGLYRTGWAKRGPRGGIPENRACAKSVAEEIVADLTSGVLPVSEATLGFDGLPASVRSVAIDYAQWLTLEQHERDLAPASRVRRKITDHNQMVAIARGRS